MRKRIISSLLILTLLITGIMLGKAPVAYASGNSETGRSSEQHDSINAAKLIVATFVAEDIKNNAESGWNQNSDVSGDATIVYDMNDGILGYMFSIYNAGIGNGYVVISTEDYGFSIIEYAYENNEISELAIDGQIENAVTRQVSMVERVYLSGTLDYIAADDNDNYFNYSGETIDFEEEPEFEINTNSDETNEAKDFVNLVSQYSDSEIESLFEDIKAGTSSDDNTSGGLITAPTTYLKNEVNSSYTYTIDSSNSKVLSGVGSKTCTDLGGHNNCTLTALYNAMVYYRDKKGYSNISSSQSGLYAVIKTQATALGYNYDTSTGLGVTKNNNLVTNVFKQYGYTSVTGSNNYAWTGASAKSAIRDYGPFLFSLASGVYYDHTVMVYGYRTYKNSSNSSTYLFWVIKDGWSSTTRYLAMTGTPESYLGCMTTIKAK